MNNSRMNLSLFFACTVGVFFLGMMPLLARAQTADASDCRFEEQFARIAEIRANTFLNTNDQVRMELEVRKDIIRKTLSCAIADTQALKEKVGAVRSDDVSVRALRTSFVNQLDAALSYYEREELKIDTLGISGSKDLARELKEWRTNTYAPTAEQTLHFLVWAKNQELFLAGANRFADIERSIASLKLLESESIAPLLSTARADLRDASAANDEAFVALQEFPPRTNAFDSIKRSLEGLAKTYEDFFNVSGEVQKLLPGSVPKAD